MKLMDKKVMPSIRLKVVAILLIASMMSMVGISLFKSNAFANAGVLSPVTTVENLQTNYETNPIGIDINTAPLFSWRMISNVIGQVQTKYQIVVYKDKVGGTVVWDSGVIKSGISNAIPYNGEAFQLETRYYWTVTAFDIDGKEIVSAPAFFESGCKWGVESNWITAKATNGAPMFRTEAELAAGTKVTSARLYITALGIYNAYINGQEPQVEKEGGKEYTSIFGPGYTNNNYTINYQSFDITKNIASDANKVAVGVVLGNGWFNGPMGKDSKPENVLASGKKELSFKAKVVVNYANGKQTVVNTNTKDWKSSDNSSITSNDFYNGEDYDATKCVKGWNNVGYDARAWSNQISVPIFLATPLIVASSQTVAYIDDSLDLKPVKAYKYNPQDILEGAKNDKTDSKYYWGEAVTTAAPITGDISLKAGQVLIVDLGQNFAGVEKFTVKGAQGDKVTVRTAEVLNDGNVNPKTSGGGSDGPKDTVYTKNLRAAKATDTYIIGATDTAETYQPIFTYHGFRYLEFTASADVVLSDIVGKVITSVLNRTGNITTNNADVNRLFQNNIWSQISNYLSVPTDCPQRDERASWAGDIQVYAKTSLYNFDMTAFINGYIDQMNTFSENTDFSFGEVMPGNNRTLFAGWSDAGVIIPWAVYQQTGDLSVLSKSYAYMDGYMKKCGALNSSSYNYSNDFFGDWLAYQGTSIQYTNMSYRAYTAQIMSDVANALGKIEDATKYSNLFKTVKNAMIKKYLDANNNLLTSTADNALVNKNGYPIVDNSQTGLLWALKLGLYNDDTQKDALTAKLLKDIANENGSSRDEFGINTLGVGFLGSNIILPILSQEGQSNTAYNLLLNTSNPSWLNEVKNGATTIWERWDSYTAENSFGESGMNSFNHFAYGSFGEWMYQYMAGIADSKSNSGFKHITLQPTLDTGVKYNMQTRITSVDGSYVSQYGNIKSAWTSAAGKMTTYRCTVPSNTTATLYLPVSNDSFQDIYGVTYKGEEVKNGVECRKFELLSGSYNFEVTSSNVKITLASGYIDPNEEPSTSDIGLGDNLGLIILIVSLSVIVLAAGVVVLAVIYKKKARS